MAKKHILIFGLFITFAVELLAVRIQRPFYTLRSKGQGGAIVGSVDDFSTVIFNPANMALMKESNLNMGFGGGFNTGFFDFISDMTKVADATNPVDRATRANELTARYSGETFAFNPFFYAAYSGPSWGIAILPLNLDTNISITEDSVQFDSYSDGIISFGMGRQYNNKLSWGFGVKGVYRGYYGELINAASLQSDQLFDADKASFGLTVDTDIALNYQFDKWKNMDSKVSFVLRNLVDQGFTLSSTETKPPKLGRKLDIGTEFKFKPLWVFQPKLMFDLRDIGIKDWDFQSGYHIGAELDWQTYDWLKGGYRIGLNQGYFTAGVNMQFAWFRLDIAVWGDEIGTKEDKKELRRTALAMTLDF